ncbi:MAG: hypothetical protein QJR05_04215 [Thermoanaerobacterium sp.]|nr:hypothetical protein [Thermoanaerobacterium sp.]
MYIIRNLQDGADEIMTHPGYFDNELFNIPSYNKNREIEKIDN